MSDSRKVHLELLCVQGGWLHAVYVAPDSCGPLLANLVHGFMGPQVLLENDCGDDVARQMRPSSLASMVSNSACNIHETAYRF